MILRFHPDVRKELRQAVEWYEEQREGLGDDLRDEIWRALSTIVEQPRRWPLSQLPAARALEVRHFVIEGFPLTIEYVAGEKHLEVFAIAHMSRRPGYWLRRIVRKR